jgi:hypothetical protein
MKSQVIRQLGHGNGEPVVWAAPHGAYARQEGVAPGRYIFVIQNLFLQKRIKLKNTRH